MNPDDRLSVLQLFTSRDKETHKEENNNCPLADNQTLFTFFLAEERNCDGFAKPKNVKFFLMGKNWMV